AEGGVHLARGPAFLLQPSLAAGRIESEPRPGLGLQVGTDAYRMWRGAVAWDRLDDRDVPRSGLAVVARGEQSLAGLGADRDYWRAPPGARGAPGRGPRLVPPAGPPPGRPPARVPPVHPSPPSRPAPPPLAP